MKMLSKVVVVFTALLFTSTVYGASTLYLPNVIEQDVSPGEVFTVPVLVSADLPVAGSYFYGLYVVGDVVGDIPREWISAQPSLAFISPSYPIADVELSFTIPDDVKPGAHYSAYLFRKLYYANTYPPIPGGWIPDEGTGVYISLTIAGQSCNEMASIGIASSGPEVLWPPTGGMKDVVISGTISVPEPCELLAAGFAVNDEYDEFTKVELMTVQEDGSFTLTVPLAAWRKGGDDGRYYEITILAATEAGISSSDVVRVTVPHDRRGKK